jgi:hypothetical protein
VHTSLAKEYERREQRYYPGSQQQRLCLQENLE